MLAVWVGKRASREIKYFCLLPMATTSVQGKCVPFLACFLGLLSSNAHPCSLGPFFTFGATILVSPVERRINRCSSTSMPLHVRVGVLVAHSSDPGLGAPYQGRPRSSAGVRTETYGG